MYKQQLGLKIMGNQEIRKQFHRRVWGRNMGYVGGKDAWQGLPQRKRGEVERGELNNEFCLVWAAGKYIWSKFRKLLVLSFRKMCSFSLQLMGESWGQVLRKDTCKGPVSRVWGLIWKHWRCRERGQVFNRSRVGWTLWSNSLEMGFS